MIDPPGTYLPVQLASVTRAPNLQHIAERVALASAQHELSPPQKVVAALVLQACEVCYILSTGMDSTNSIYSLSLSN
jgi:hypothetical protein